MATGTSLAALKRSVNFIPCLALSIALSHDKLDDLSKQIFEIDLKIQTLAQQNKQQEVSNLKAAKVQLQKGVVDLEIQYELQKA